MKPTYDELVDLVDRWYKIYRDNNIQLYGDNEEDLINTSDYFDDISTKTARALVDTGRYKEDDLFWTQETIDKAEEFAKSMMEGLFEKEE